ncbi:MAG: PD40 domain-containing protein [Bryobacteraceae bacterium]|nr:PD40 domain-containing protein [Bryobacteraceae bacterium]
MGSIQVTHHPSVSHPSYFLQSSFLPGDQSVFFTSYRTGAAHLWTVSLEDGSLSQLTDGPAIHPFSPAYDERRDEIVFTRGGSLETLDRVIFTLPSGGQLGECSLSACGDWAVAAFRLGSGQGLAVGRLDGSGWKLIPFPRTVIHPQFHPLEPEWIEFAGDPAPRMHRVRRDGSGLECLYEHSNDEFVVHETFLGQTGDLVFTVWPFRLCRMDWTTREMSVIVEHNAWHIAPNRAGTEILFDTNHPDRGIQIVDVASGSIRDVCPSEASNGGSQWRESRYALAEDFARARSEAAGNLSWMEAGVDTVYGPQWTHPHPSWSRDERRIAFASDRTGHTQVYIADVPRLSA